MNYRVVLLLGITLLFLQSCNHEEGEVKRIDNPSNQYELELIKELFKDMKELREARIKKKKSHSNISAIINEYFYLPSEITDSAELEHLINYEVKFNFFNRYLRDNDGPLKVYWDEEITKHHEFHWIYDKGQCEKTLLLTYLTKDSEIDWFCACYRDEKIYSVLPHGGESRVLWARKLKSIKLDSNRVFVGPAEWN